MIEEKQLPPFTRDGFTFIDHSERFAQFKQKFKFIEIQLQLQAMIIGKKLEQYSLHDYISFVSCPSQDFQMMFSEHNGFLNFNFDMKCLDFMSRNANGRKVTLPFRNVVYLDYDAQRFVGETPLDPDTAQSLQNAVQVICDSAIEVMNFLGMDAQYRVRTLETLLPNLFAFVFYQPGAHVLGRDTEDHKDALDNNISISFPISDVLREWMIEQGLGGELTKHTQAQAQELILDGLGRTRGEGGSNIHFPLETEEFVVSFLAVLDQVMSREYLGMREVDFVDPGLSFGSIHL